MRRGGNDMEMNWRWKSNGNEVGMRRISHMIILSSYVRVCVMVSWKNRNPLNWGPRVPIFLGIGRPRSLFSWKYGNHWVPIFPGVWG